MAILVTGGAGYIGSHTLIELANAGFKPIVLDNLSNSCKEAVDRASKLASIDIPFFEGDIADSAMYDAIFADYNIEACIHFAGLKAVGESVAEPLKYYKNNVSASLVLFEELKKRKVNNIIFSSSATVYGDPDIIPITEDCKRGEISSPYGETKAILEDLLKDMARIDKRLNVVLLRYFNPIGAHESGLIGEDPEGIPNNLMPYITQVAVGRLPKLNVFGNDYETHDGTGVRDYIHVVDLAIGHVKALEKLGLRPDAIVAKEIIGQGINKNIYIYNLGRGEGVSVLELLRAYEEVSSTTIPYEITARRPGDVAKLYCDTNKAKRELDFLAKRDVRQMCMDSHRWQSNNPKGYRDS